MFPTVGSPAQTGVTQHVPRMRRVACRILGREDLAEDAVQEALITAHEIRELPAKHLEAWLLRTVTHRSLAARRAHLRRRRNEQAAAETLGTKTPGFDPERQLLVKQLGDQIIRALGALPSEQRQAFELCEIGGMDYSQIAELQRVPIGTVRSRLNRARQALRRQLQRMAVPVTHRTGVA